MRADSRSRQETAVKDYLTGGNLAPENQTDQIREKAKHGDRNNNKHAESVFDILKENAREHRGLPISVTSGLVAAKKSGVFEDRAAKLGAGAELQARMKSS